MTVKELIKELKEYPEDLTVCQSIWMEVHNEADIQELDFEMFTLHNDGKPVFILNCWVK